MPYLPMDGVRVLEVAQYAFTPTAGAVLAEWGAEVIKVEHPVTGDAARGLRLGTGGAADGRFQPLMDHPNRGKRSIGLALDMEDGRDILYEIARTCDVFLTNFLPPRRQKMGITVEAIRAVNPDIIYACGSGMGPKGPEADKGGYDGCTFWSRAGAAMGSTPNDSPRLINQPSGAFGDTLGGTVIAAGIAAALFRRERSGEVADVDVSLLSLGVWAMSLSIGNALLTGGDVQSRPLQAPPHLPVNPLVGNYRTADSRYVNLTMLQPKVFWQDVCSHLGLTELIDDPRFATAELLIKNTAEAGKYLEDAFAAHPIEHWRQHLQTLSGPWSINQTAFEVTSDPQVLANDYITEFIDETGTPRRLVANPVQFNQTSPALRPAPSFAEHTDEILVELGRTEDEIIALKLAGVTT